jgi:hypothetical protein
MNDENDDKDDRAHHALCTGHIECPKCDRSTCAHVVVTAASAAGERADSVVCLSCWSVFGVREEASGPCPP